jgi:hypothetical protein
LSVHIFPHKTYQTHPDEPVALVVRVEHCAKSSRCEVKSTALARAVAVGAGHDQAELVVDKASVGDEDGATTVLGQAARVGDVDADAAVHRAIVI